MPLLTISLRPAVTRLNVASLPTLLMLGIVLLQLAPTPTSAAEPTVHRDLPYAEHKGAPKNSTSLDLYVPPDAKLAPIVVWIHGGGWRHGDKRMVALKPAYFCDQGMILASINYRLQPATDYRGQAADVAAAVRWLVDHAAEYGGDPQRIILLGHSAGAHMAALVAADHSYLETAKVDPKVLRGVILLDGAGYDVPRQIKEARLPALKKLYRDAFGDDPEVWEAASPLHHVKEGGAYPPVLILYVANRRDSSSQSVALSERLRAVGGEAEAIGYADKTHATINREFGAADDEPTAAAQTFLDHVLTPAASR
jgi:arylformamidase